MSDGRRAFHLWLDIFDYLAPLLRLKGREVTLYMYLLRHTRLLGRATAFIGLKELAQVLFQCTTAARFHLMRLIRKGCVAVRARGGPNNGSKLEVFLPSEIIPKLGAAPKKPAEAHEYELTKRGPKLRRAVYRREKGKCFYCCRNIRLKDMWLDHVVPTSRGGSFGADNVVASCQHCNRRKQAQPAEKFLRDLRARKVITRYQYRRQISRLILLRRGKWKLAA